MAICNIQNSDENEIDRIVQTEFINEIAEGYINVDGNGTYMPMYYNKFSDAIKNFPIQDSDIIVASYPKAGTTWTQEMVWLIEKNCDFEGAKVNLKERFPFFEVCTLYNFEKFDSRFGTTGPAYRNNSIEFCKQLRSPRFIKTHLPFSLLPADIQYGRKSPKIIYVTRNPKDTCVSYYHHGKIIQEWKTNFENFCKVFLAEKIMYGSFWKHVLGYWNQRSLPNLLIITYEDMKKDNPSIIRKVAEFMGKSLTDEQVEKLTKHLSFEAMKNNAAVNFEDALNMKRKHNLLPEDETFMRSGKVGKYKEEMSPETIEKFNAWSKKWVANADFYNEYSNYVV